MRSIPMLLLAGAITITGCAPAATIPSSALTRSLTAPRDIVRVSNHGWDEIELIAMRGGTRRILGVVSGAQETTLVISEDMLDTDGTLQLAARVRGKHDVLFMRPLRVPPWELRRLVARERLRTIDGEPLPALISNEKNRGTRESAPAFFATCD